MFVSRGRRVWYLKISPPSALRRCAVSLNPVLTTDTIMSSVVCFLFCRSEMPAESVTEPTSSFADVTRSACTTSNDVNEITSGTCELLSNCQWSTKGVDLGR